jgi:hypothetical protein
MPRSVVAFVVPVAGGLLAAGWDALYLWVLWQEQEGDSGDLGEPGVWFIAVSIAAAAVVLLLSSALPWRIIRAGGLAACAGALLGFAIIASLSLGVFLLPAAVLAFLASREALAQVPSRTATKVSLTGLAIGLSLPAVFLFALAPV